jgi:heat-inducible transcriptional repressor
MTERQEQLLRHVVEIYIESAEPVSSSRLVELSNLGVSSATIRNDLSALENDGFIASPHTSAGRVPTDRGYRYYIESFVHKAQKADRARRMLQVQKREHDFELQLQNIARRLAEITGNAVVLSVGPKRAYTTGVEQLFSMPEFHELEMVRFVGMMDKMAQLFEPMFNEAFEDVRIMIGDEGPLGQQMSSVMVHFQAVNGQPGMMSIVGPTRMNYERNVALLREAKIILNNI